MKITYSDGTPTVAYGYDADGNTTYAYDAGGRLTTATESNGVTETRTYDGAGQVTGITDSKGTTTLDSYQLTMDANEHPTQVAVTQNGTVQPTRFYTYGPAERLATSCQPSCARPRPTASAAWR